MDASLRDRLDLLFVAVGDEQYAISAEDVACEEARIGGGVSILGFADLSDDVGARNVRAARETLERLEVPIVGEAVGGDHGRTVVFDTATGGLAIHTAFGDAPESL